MGQSPGSRVPKSTSSRRTPDTVHYEETLSIPFKDHVSETLEEKGITGIVITIVFMLTIFLGFTVPAVMRQRWDAAIFFAFLIGGIYWLMYRSFDRKAHVYVTDDRVEINKKYALGEGGETFTIPFDRITGVQYRDPNAAGPHIYVQIEDKPTRSFLVHTPESASFITGEANISTQPANVYDNGIRIERVDDSPVYVGSENPIELATEIAERSPNVSGVRSLDL